MCDCALGPHQFLPLGVTKKLILNVNGLNGIQPEGGYDYFVYSNALLALSWPSRAPLRLPWADEQ